MHQFNSSLTEPQNPSVPALWFIFRRSHLLVRWEADGQAVVPQVVDVAEVVGENTAVRPQYLGQFAGQDCHAAELLDPETPAPEGYQFVGLRQLFHQLDPAMFQIAGRAVQMVAWARDHQYCGRCGTPTNHASDRAKVCPACELRAYPRLSPAVIMAVTRGEELLLAHGVRHPAKMYSVLAGFAEPGETLEECVAREVGEEVGLQVGDIRYFGSQPWPFPNSLMIGFTAVYTAGTITPSPEIEHAGWYTRQQIQSGELFLPPASISIAGQLIEAFVQQG
jgi:NAD+ diphosphatase